MMDSKMVLLTLNDRFHAALIGALSDLTDQQIYAIAPAIDQRPILEVARHAYSNVLGCLLWWRGANGLWTSGR